MPEGAVTLPTPEQERKTVFYLIVFTALAILGTAFLLAAIGMGLVRLFQWVFPGVLT